jgi:hypothetical protein
MDTVLSCVKVYAEFASASGACTFGSVFGALGHQLRGGRPSLPV